ncbi:MAG: hypothetical protein WC310_05235 [Patescibacteria group bacterium]
MEPKRLQRFLREFPWLYGIKLEWDSKKVISIVVKTFTVQSVQNRSVYDLRRVEQRAWFLLSSNFGGWKQRVVEVSIQTNGYFDSIIKRVKNKFPGEEIDAIVLRWRVPPFVDTEDYVIIKRPKRQSIEKFFKD